MKSLLRFEYKKSIYSKKIFLSIIICLSLMITFIFYLNYKDKAYINDYIYEMTQMKNYSYSIIESSNNAVTEISNSKINDEEKTKLIKEIGEKKNHFIKIYDLTSKLMLRKVNNFNLEDLQNQLDYEKSLKLIQEKKYLSLREPFFKVNFNPNLEEKIKTDEYLIRNNISPLNSPFEMNLVNFLDKLTYYKGTLIFVICILLASVDSFTSDFDFGTYKIIYSKSTSRKNVILSKLIFNILSNVIAILCSFIIIALFVSIKFKVGNFMYPVKVGHFGIYNFKDAYLMKIPLLILLIISINAAIMYFSIKYKNTKNVVNILLAFIALDMFLRLSIQQNSFLFNYWPLQILGIGEMFAYINNAIIWWIKSAIILIVSIFLITRSLKNISKEDL